MDDSSRNVFPLPFGTGEGQGERIDGNMPIGRSFPLSPAAEERENGETATVFCRPSHGLLSRCPLWENP